MYIIYKNYNVSSLRQLNNSYKLVCFCKSNVTRRLRKTDYVFLLGLNKLPFNIMLVILENLKHSTLINRYRITFNGYDKKGSK